MSSPTHRRVLFTTALVGSLTLTACGGGGFEEDDAAAGSDSEPRSAGENATLRMLIASSGDAETDAVKEATQRWAEQTGHTVEVVVASDIAQELAQGFAGGNPPDVFYLDAAKFADQAQAGNLFPYQAEDNEDFYEPLREAFTHEGTQYCAPKDFSTLALQINDAAWQEAGLTEADYPTSYQELADVAETLTEGDQTGLVLTSGIDRLGVFAQGNGGWWVNEDGTEATASSDPVKTGVQYVQDNVKKGAFAIAGDVDAGWGGEAFGNGRGAMTIEGNWIKGAMRNDYPDLDYTVVDLPEGPEGTGNLSFTQCWGIAADSPAQAEAVELVDFLASEEQQLAFADAFGVMPSRESAATQYAEKYPEDKPFVDAAADARPPINVPGLDAVIADLNSKMETISSVDVDAALTDFDTNAEAVLNNG